MKKRNLIITLYITIMLALPACGTGTASPASDSAETSPQETAAAFGTAAPEPAVDASVTAPPSETPSPAEPLVKQEDQAEPETAESSLESDSEAPAQAEPEEQAAKDAEATMQMKIGDTAVETVWEENESVEALKALCTDAPLVIEMSMYGGFEQVGAIGTGLPRNDAQTTTEAGDIVLYSGDQIVVFYGSNSWAYTRLGHITDRSPAEMEALLGGGDVTVTISMEAGT